MCTITWNGYMLREREREGEGEREGERGREDKWTGRKSE